MFFFSLCCCSASRSYKLIYNFFFLFIYLERWLFCCFFFFCIFQKKNFKRDTHLIFVCFVMYLYDNCSISVFVSFFSFRILPLHILLVQLFDGFYMILRKKKKQKYKHLNGCSCFSRKEWKRDTARRCYVFKCSMLHIFFVCLFQCINLNYFSKRWHWTSKKKSLRMNEWMNEWWKQMFTIYLIKCNMNRTLPVSNAK